MTDTNVQYQESEDSPLQDVAPQDSPLQDVVPQDTPLQDVVFHESPLQDVVFIESPLQDVIPQDSPLQDELPLTDVEPQKSTLSGVEPQGLALRNVGEQKELKKERVREACRRLKQKEKELQKRTSPQENVVRDKVEKGIEIMSSDEFSLSSTPGSSSETINEKMMRTEYNDVEDDVVKMVRERDDDAVEMMAVKNASVTESVSPDKLSVADGYSSEDPMYANVNELMLVPSISDLSLSDDPGVKPEISQKSVSSAEQLSRTESDSLESESEESTEPPSSYCMFPTIENERPDDSTELDIQDRMSTETDDVLFDEIPRPEKSMDLSQFFSEGNEKGSQSSFVQDTRKISLTYQIVRDFIDMLISQVTSGPNAVELKRIQLDKDKLYRGLRESVEEHMEAAFFNDVINGLMVEYYRLNKDTRVLAELSDEDKKSYYNRYRTALNCVAYGEECVAAAKTASSRLTVLAQLELNNAILGSLGTEHHFEQTVRRLLLRDSESELLKRLIDRELRLMDQFRAEISYERYLMVILQHDLAQLKNEINDLDSVGGHVSMQQFISLQAKVYGFQIKIEERNTDLRKLRVQYLRELHMTQHNREKIQALKDRLASSKKQLDIKYQQRNSLKENLYLAKIQRKTIQEKSKELAYRGGILSMPSLMHDYDRTLDDIQQKQERIAGLKETVRSLTQRLSAHSQFNLNSEPIS